MDSLNKNQQNNCNISHKRNAIDETFEQNAGVKIHNKDKYSGGSGFYSTKANAKCPNVYDNMNHSHSGNSKR